MPESPHPGLGVPGRSDWWIEPLPRHVFYPWDRPSRWISHAENHLPSKVRKANGWGSIPHSSVGNKPYL